ncbi:MAG: hypothetical protein AAF483_06955 [Planctomycetota bacterium]
MHHVIKYLTVLALFAPCLALRAQTGRTLSEAVTPVARSSRAFPEANSEGVVAERNSSAVILRITDSDLKTCNIPRLCAPLRSVKWAGHDDPSISVKPEQEYWIIKWNKRPQGADTILLQFGGTPLLPEEIVHITSQPDGSYLLPAHFAKATGEKVRYEPQSYKNTVGYWVGPEDNATWKLDVEKSGSFNVAILQGCGTGQGGSDAKLSTMHSGAKEAYTALDFQILETGHFQNFQWRTLGTIDLEAGTQTLKIQPIRIANKALMDVRAVHLIRLPEPKK